MEFEELCGRPRGGSLPPPVLSDLLPFLGPCAGENPAWGSFMFAGMTSEVERLTCDLVAIESVNPDLVASGSGEANIGRFVAEWLAGAGLEVEIVDPIEGRPSVVGVLRGSGGGRSLMLNAHMDTVGAGGMKDPFKPVIADGRIHGRGAYDMKGSLAAIMVAAREAKKLALRGDVIVTAVADEEVASLGTSAVLERFHADAAIVTEPTELRVCLAHKGFVWLEVETRGVAAHGSRPHDGVDAIGRMGRILTGLVNLDRRLRLGAGHRLLGRGSVHGSLIEGGQEWSTYPARCAVKVERRTIPGEDGARALKEMEALIEIAREDTPNLEASARVVLERAPSELAADHPVALAVATAAREALGRDPEAIGVAYWMDMALTNGAGIPTAAFGPSGEGAHADVEWVDAASLATCVQVYLRAAELICGA
jgi:acetylornithine deacetylase/succinyl-diaminopimelate desuccinylase family protein